MDPQIATPNIGAMSVEEAARYIGVCRSTVYEEIGTGKLKARKCGARTLLLFEDVQSYLRSLPTLETGAAA